MTPAQEYDGLGAKAQFAVKGSDRPPIIVTLRVQNFPVDLSQLLPGKRTLPRISEPRYMTT
jgi:hypothetical protein